jgi:lipopolysaccharide transport system permease protein
MARIALPPTWIGVLSRQRGPLRLYQWLWLALCLAGGVVVAAPRIVSQPLVYHATAETRFDVAQYPSLYDASGAPAQDFRIAVDDATNALRQRLFAQREVRFGLPDFRVEYQPLAPGVVRVLGVAPTALEAQLLANRGAEELARQIQAAGGREILRTMLNWEFFQVFRSAPPGDSFAATLRPILELRAFPLSREIESSERRVALDHLAAAEQGYLARALESRSDLWRFEINTRNATLDAVCDTVGVTGTAAREAALRTCAATTPAAQAELAARDGAIQRLQAIDAALRYLIERRGLAFTPDAPGPVYRVAAAAPAAPVERNIGPLLLLAALVGLAFGVAGVALDRSAGVMPKLAELWSYRELVRNLVLRDLRVRYRGSVLGYLWTQIAPLLLMLVFWLVFSIFFQSGIAMFPVFVLAALLPWNYCNEAVSGGARSVLDNANLVKKVFFPREVLPLVAVLSSLVNFLLSLPMLLLVAATVQFFYPPLRELGRMTNFSVALAYIPVLLLIQTIFLAGMVLGLSALSVRYRDLVHLIGIGLQFWFFLTPVVYSLDVVGGTTAQVVRWLNPMASLVEFYREVIYGSAVAAPQIPTPGFPALESVLRVLLTSLVVLALGYWYFQRRSGQFGERL